MHTTLVCTAQRCPQELFRAWGIGNKNRNSEATKAKALALKQGKRALVRRKEHTCLLWTCQDAGPVTKRGHSYLRVGNRVAKRALVWL